MNSVSIYKNPDFWIFGPFFFIYFFIMAIYFPFFPIWLSDVIGLSKMETGIVFSFMSLLGIILQPLFGFISDRLGLKKNLIFSISLLLLFFAPFFLYVFAPLLLFNIWIGALVGAVYVGIVFSAGAPTIEAYIERVSRRSGFEYGKVRMFGCYGWGISASITGILFSIDPSIVFWIGSGFGALLLFLLYLASRTGQTAKVLNIQGVNSSLVSAKTVFSLFRMRQMWMFVLYVIGVACIYDVFDQQFATFFRSFFDTHEAGTQVFGFATTAGEFCNGIVMFFVPWIINRIGAKNALLVAGLIMTIRITGSSFATTITEVVILKMLHCLEVPFLLVGVFKYTTVIFSTRLSATVYLVGFNLSKLLAAIPLSTFAGYLYDHIGFQNTYLMLGMIALIVTVISAFTLTSHKRILT
ncbi:MFS transporter [Campylobacter estrildidarum]|uniref:MFS transporter n=1 Tax=Campylobacter estrildidarum TaxID=2510189 RepID=A0A4U7BLS9_9BACT|nr:MFS transporter [Campylobacter estrildidarum]TKX31501.1 MFS transporter [Campylobacter estrildidarum]